MTRAKESRPVILIVDDEPMNRALLRALLNPIYEIQEAENGPSALDILEGHPVDLVLLDVMMPVMNGFEVCRLIKEKGGEYLPVLLLTALDQQDQRNAGLSAGADDFLSKPVDRHELLLRVQTFVRLREQDQRIREQLDELRARDELIQQQMRELQELDVIKDDLVSLMVHDLRNPLAGVMGFLGALKLDLEDERLRNDAEMALQASNRLREILDDMLHVRMLESGTVRLHRELVQAGALVEDAIRSVWGAARARRIEIAPDIEIADLSIQGDRKLIRRAVENLLTNALKYSPTGSTVRAAVRPAGDSVEIEIADRGAGIPNELKEQLFQKFGSVESARGEARVGVGLGLYLVKLVATAHGGSASVRDRKHGGSAFGLLIPRTGTHD